MAAPNYGWKAPRIGTVAKPQRLPPLGVQHPSESTLPLALNLLKPKRQRRVSSGRNWGEEEDTQQQPGEEPSAPTPELPAPDTTPELPPAAEAQPISRLSEFQGAIEQGALF